MRYRLQVRRNLINPLGNHVQSITESNSRVRWGFLDLLDLNCQQCETLIDVVMKLFRNSGAFALLCLYQLSTNVRESLRCLFALRHVDTDPDVTSKSVIPIKPWHSNIEHPSIFSVVPSEPILHSELLATIKGLRVGVKAPLQIFAMNSLGPTISELGIN